MCIVLLSNTHPEYDLIVLNNRDEFLNRPTAPASWWDPPNQTILGGRDLLRKERGTWLSIHRDGRIAVLTNFREEGHIKPEAKSRGSLIVEYLTRESRDQAKPNEFLQSLIDRGGLDGIGGFSLVYGTVGQPLAVISNRTTDPRDLSLVLQGQETIGLSNALITNRSWTKVTEGEDLLRRAIEVDVTASASQQDFIESLFEILSRDTLPRVSHGEDWETQVRELRKSIFIPAVGGDATSTERSDQIAAARPDDGTPAKAVDKPQVQDTAFSGAYGTQKQTVILVSKDGTVTFVERTLNHGKSDGAMSREDRSFRFMISR